MNIFQVFSIELAVAIGLILAYGFFNDKLVKIEHKIASVIRSLFTKKVNNEQ